MKIFDLNKGYKFSSVLHECGGGVYDIPQNLDELDLPLDFHHFYEKQNIEQSSGTPALTLYKALPAIKKFSKVFLYFCGINGCLHVYLNGVKIDKVFSAHPKTVDITHCVSSAKNILMLVFYPQVGAVANRFGVSDGIKMWVTESDRFIMPKGLYVETESVEDKARLKVKAELNCLKGENSQVELLTEIFNIKNKRVYKKVKKIRTGKETAKTIEIPVNLSRFFKWTSSDPYLYKARVTLAGNPDEYAETVFGIARHHLKNKKLASCGEELKLSGACVSTDNGILGHMSVYEYELMRAEKLKQSGFNAVRVLGMPSEAMLQALDETGLMAFVDVFDKWEQEGEFLYDFESNCAVMASQAVKMLRSHPSVAAYSICNNAGETYLRGNGLLLRDAIVSAIKAADTSRLLTASVTELKPVLKEIDELNGRQKINKENTVAAACNLAREKDLFIDRIRKFMSALDFAGYDGLHARYFTDVAYFPVAGFRTLPKKTADALEEAEKNSALGDFAYLGWDTSTELTGCPIKEGDLVRPYCSDIADLDLTGEAKPQNFYRRILTGNRSQSYIVSISPEKEEGVTGFENVSHTWYYPRFLGKAVNVEVYTGGDVVALYLDGKLIGRKLAGKVNRHKAVFSVAYYPGVLEAVSYFKGRECSRCTLESVSAPKALKLSVDKKTLQVGEYSFIEASVLDKEGRRVPYAVREIEVKVVGEGELVAMGNGDPWHRVEFGKARCPVFNGKALIAVRAVSEGKMHVKVEADGLLSYKITLKVK